MKIRLFLPLVYFAFLTIYHYDRLFCQGDDSIRKGHLEPLGQAGSIYDIDYYDGFPPMDQFFQDYVYKSKPLLMKAAAISSPAYTLWSDDYFLSFPEINDLQVMIEQPKDENLNLKIKTGSFKEFLLRYKTTNEYLVDRVPPFFQKDVYMPTCILCDAIDYFDNILWFSNGGTKSTLHTDSMENLNCLFRGSKDLIMINKTYSQKGIIDVIKGHYSTVNVDRVNLDQFPKLAQVEYYKAHMEPGDCLYIPYLWYHQVRSYNYNIAVNIWFKHYSKPIDLSSCINKSNANQSIDQVRFIGMDGDEESDQADDSQNTDVEDDQLQNENALTDFITDSLGDKNEIELDAFIAYMQNELPTLTKANDKKRLEEIATTSCQIFKKLDADNNGYVTLSEVENLSAQDETEINMIASHLLTTADAISILNENRLENGKTLIDTTTISSDSKNQAIGSQKHYEL